MAPAEVVDPLIYDGFVEELVDILELSSPSLQVGIVSPDSHVTTHI